MSSHRFARPATAGPSTAGAAPRAALLLAFLLAACGGKHPAAPAGQPVTAITLKAQPAAISVDYPGQIEASNTVEIRPRVGGVLELQEAVEGQVVHRGQLLFQIDRGPYAAALAQAQAALAQALATAAQTARDLARVQPLSAVDALSQRELDAAVAADSSAKAQIESTRAAVKNAQLNLSWTEVRAPIDGTMSRALIRLGGVVTAYTTLLTTLYQLDPVYVNFAIGEQRLLQVQKDLGRAPDQSNPSQRTFHLMLSDGSEYPLPAKLNFVDAAVDTRTDTLAVRLTVPNPQRMLKPGLYVRVISAAAERPNALLIPQRAVQTLQDKSFVWTVDDKQQAQPRDVVMGQQIGSDWVVEKGLSAGDIVVIDGTQKLRPGTLVQVQAPAAAAPAATAQKPGA
jgi:membrane fusion protein (multidrug efflux system)